MVATTGKSYKEFLKDGDGFLNRARKSILKQDIFTPEIIYNIAGMAIEKYIMAYLMYNGTLPDNHTFRDLLDGISRVKTPPENIVEILNFMDGFQDICSIEKYKILIPTKEDVKKIIDAGNQIEVFVKNNILT
jgi:hypothetical protein